MLWWGRWGRRGWRWGRTWTASSVRLSFFKIFLLCFFSWEIPPKGMRTIRKFSTRRHTYFLKEWPQVNHSGHYLAVFKNFVENVNHIFIIFIAFKFVFHNIFFHSRPTRFRPKRKCTTTVACFYQHNDPLVNLIPLNKTTQKLLKFVKIPVLVPC